MLLTALGACGFAVKGIFAKLLYARGWHYEQVVTIRALLSWPVIWAWASWREGARLAYDGPLRARFGAALAGFVCYFVGTNLDFRALTLVDASIERVLLFAYPSMVVVLHAVIYRQRPTPRAIASLTCTYAGILMVVSGFDLRILRANMAGASLVLGCALTYALYYLASDRWGARIGAIRFTLAAVTSSAAAFAIQYLLTGTGRALPEIRSTDVALIAALVLLSTVLPMVLTAEGVRRLGAPRAAVISTIGPPVTIALGALLLGESLTAPQCAGVALIALGIFVLESSARTRAAGR